MTGRSNMPPSPCTKLCQMAADTGLCKGCFRTLEEISSWATLSNDDKRVLLGVLKDREHNDV